MSTLPIQHGYCDEAALRVCYGLMLAAAAVGFVALLGLLKAILKRRWTR